MAEYEIQTGHKPILAPRRYRQRSIRSVSIVPAWRVIGDDGSETKWTSIEGEAIAWRDMLVLGHRPVSAY